MGAVAEKTTEVVLPYRVTAEQLRRGVETLRVHKESASALAAAFRSKRLYVTGALEALGLVEAGSLRLTDLGLDLAYAGPGNVSAAFRQAARAYSPYRDALTHFLAARDQVTEADAIASFWGKKRVGASDQNRAEGALVFAHVCAAAGLGNLILGRGGARSRIEWAGDAEQQFANSRDVRAPDQNKVTAPVPPAKREESLSKAPPLEECEIEAFRLVLPRARVGSLSLPVGLELSDIRALKAQIEAVFTLIKARLTQDPEMEGST